MTLNDLKIEKITGFY